MCTVAGTLPGLSRFNIIFLVFCIYLFAANILVIQVPSPRAHCFLFAGRLACVDTSNVYVVCPHLCQSVLTNVDAPTARLVCRHYRAGNGNHPCQLYHLRRQVALLDGPAADLHIPHYQVGI